MLVEKNYKEYLEILSSDSPSPGGGSVSALSGGLSVALMQMVCSLSMNKKGLEEHRDTFIQYFNEAQEYKEYFVTSVDEDSEAFSLVIDAFKMPKNTETEIQARREAIQVGYKHAAQVPFEVGAKAYEFLDFLENMVDISNKSAITDVYVSALQLLACIQGAFVNVRINLSSIKDEDFVNEKTLEMEKILTNAQDRVNNIKMQIEKML